MAVLTTSIKSSFKRPGAAHARSFSRYFRHFAQIWRKKFQGRIQPIFSTSDMMGEINFPDSIF